MKRTEITSITIPLLDVSSYNVGRDYLPGDAEFTLAQWETNPPTGYLIDSKITVRYSELPLRIREAFTHFDDMLAQHLREQV
jgi:hypothetical protein